MAHYMFEEFGFARLGIGLTVLDLQSDTTDLSGLGNIAAMVLHRLALQPTVCPLFPRHHSWRRSWR